MSDLWHTVVEIEPAMKVGLLVLLALWLHVRDISKKLQGLTNSLELLAASQTQTGTRRHMDWHTPERTYRSTLKKELDMLAADVKAIIDAEKQVANEAGDQK